MSLDDPRWGRKNTDSDSADDKEVVSPSDPRRGTEPPQEPRQEREEPRPSQTQRPQRAQQGNDLDELWDEFNRMLGGVLGQPGSRRQGGHEPPNGGNEPPQEPHEPARGRGRAPVISPQTGLKGIATLVLIALAGWCATGFYIVPEGQIGVVTTFGRYTNDAAAGFRWHLPWPVQEAELVDVSSVRKAEIGMRGVNRSKEALMLTDDENIVDVQFNVQYRIKPHMAKDYLFRTRMPDQSVTQAAESAMREVVGRKAMDSILFESKQEIAANVKKAMQEMLDRYHTGIEVMSVAIQNAQPPQPVQAAFNDAVKAGQDRERQINEGEAYANAVIPKAKGMASRLTQEAEGYKARVIETAQGDSQRFSRVLAEYEKAPQVTRDRLYVDAMKDIYQNTRKVYVDSKSAGNLLYLPLDQLMRKSAQPEKVETVVQAEASQAPASAPRQVAPEPEYDSRASLRRNR